MNKEEIIRIFEAEVEKEIQQESDAIIAGQEEDEFYYSYLKYIEPQINDFFGKNGIRKQFIASEGKDFCSWIVDNIHDDDPKFMVLVEFCESLVSVSEYASLINHKEKNVDWTASSYTKFHELCMPFGMCKKEFSSEEAYKRYMGCCYWATHDFD